MSHVPTRRRARLAIAAFAALMMILGGASSAAARSAEPLNLTKPPVAPRACKPNVTCGCSASDEAGLDECTADHEAACENNGGSAGDAVYWQNDDGAWNSVFVCHQIVIA